MTSFVDRVSARDPWTGAAVARREATDPEPGKETRVGEELECEQMTEPTTDCYLTHDRRLLLDSRRRERVDLAQSICLSAICMVGAEELTEKDAGPDALGRVALAVADTLLGGAASVLEKAMEETATIVRATWSRMIAVGRASAIASAASSGDSLRRAETKAFLRLVADHAVRIFGELRDASLSDRELVAQWRALDPTIHVPSRYADEFSDQLRRFRASGIAELGVIDPVIDMMDGPANGALLVPETRSLVWLCRPGRAMVLMPELRRGDVWIEQPDARPIDHDQEQMAIEQHVRVFGVPPRKVFAW